MGFINPSLIDIRIHFSFTLENHSLLRHSLGGYLLRECFIDGEKGKKLIKSVISKLKEYTEEELNHDVRVTCKLTLELTDDSITYFCQVIKKGKKNGGSTKN